MAESDWVDVDDQEWVDVEERPKSFGQIMSSSALKGLKDVHTEGVSPFLSGLNTLAFGAPKAALKNPLSVLGLQGVGDKFFPETSGKLKDIGGRISGALFPEQTTIAGKGGRILSEGFGLFGGGASKLAQGAASKITGGGIRKGVVGGATFGATQLSEEPTAGGQALQGVVGGLGGTAVGAGVKAVKSLPKLAGDFISEKLAPRVSKMFNESVSKFSPEIQRYAQKSLKVPEGAINTIKKKGVDFVKGVQKKYNDSTDGIFRNIQSGFENKESQIENLYKNVVRQKPVGFKGTIDANPIYKEIKKVFSGSLGESVRSPQQNQLLAIMRDLERRIPEPKGFFAPGAKVPTPQQLTRQFRGENLINISKEIRITKKQFMEIRDALNALYRENPFDRNIGRVADKLYQVGEDSGLKGLQNVRKLQKEVFRKRSEFLNRRGELKALGNEKSLDRFHNLSKEQVRKLKEIEDYTGVKFLDDLDSLTSAREFQKIEDIGVSQFGKESKLITRLRQADSAEQFKSIKREFADLLGESKELDTIFKEIDSFRKIQNVKTLGLRPLFRSLTNPVKFR